MKVRFSSQSWDLPHVTLNSRVSWLKRTQWASGMAVAGGKEQGVRDLGRGREALKTPGGDHSSKCHWSWREGQRDRCPGLPDVSGSSLSHTSPHHTNHSICVNKKPSSVHRFQETGSTYPYAEGWACPCHRCFFFLDRASSDMLASPCPWGGLPQN